MHRAANLGRIFISFSLRDAAPGTVSQARSSTQQHVHMQFVISAREFEADGSVP